MDAVVKISSHTQHTLTRHSGNSLCSLITNSLGRQNWKPGRIVFGFDGIRDVSVSFIQATILKLYEDGYHVELINIGDAVRFKIASLIRITKVDPQIFKKADRYPQAAFYI